MKDLILQCPFCQAKFQQVPNECPFCKQKIPEEMAFKMAWITKVDSELNDLYKEKKWPEDEFSFSMRDYFHTAFYKLLQQVASLKAKPVTDFTSLLNPDTAVPPVSSTLEAKPDITQGSEQRIIKETSEFVRDKEPIIDSIKIDFDKTSEISSAKIIAAEQKPEILQKPETLQDRIEKARLARQKSEQEPQESSINKPVSIQKTSHITHSSKKKTAQELATKVKKIEEPIIAAITIPIFFVLFASPFIHNLRNEAVWLVFAIFAVALGFFEKKLRDSNTKYSYRILELYTILISIVTLFIIIDNFRTRTSLVFGTFLFFLLVVAYSYHFAINMLGIGIIATVCLFIAASISTRMDMVMLFSLLTAANFIYLICRIIKYIAYGIRWLWRIIVSKEIIVEEFEKVVETQVSREKAKENFASKKEKIIVEPYIKIKEEVFLTQEKLDIPIVSTDISLVSKVSTPKVPQISKISTPKVSAPPKKAWLVQYLSHPAIRENILLFLGVFLIMAGETFFVLNSWGNMSDVMKTLGILALLLSSSGIFYFLARIATRLEQTTTTLIFYFLAIFMLPLAIILPTNIISQRPIITLISVVIILIMAWEFIRRISLVLPILWGRWFIYFIPLLLINLMSPFIKENFPTNWALLSYGSFVFLLFTWWKIPNLNRENLFEVLKNTKEKLSIFLWLIVSITTFLTILAHFQYRIFTQFTPTATYQTAYIPPYMYSIMPSLFAIFLARIDHKLQQSNQTSTLSFLMILSICGSVLGVYLSTQNLNFLLGSLILTCILFSFYTYQQRSVIFFLVALLSSLLVYFLLPTPIRDVIIKLRIWLGGQIGYPDGKLPISYYSLTFLPYLAGLVCLGHFLIKKQQTILLRTLQGWFLTISVGLLALTKFGGQDARAIFVALPIFSIGYLAVIRWLQLPILTYFSIGAVSLWVYEIANYFYPEIWMPFATILALSLSWGIVGFATRQKLNSPTYHSSFILLGIVTLWLFIREIFLDYQHYKNILEPAIFQDFAKLWFAVAILWLSMIFIYRQRWFWISYIIAVLYMFSNNFNLLLAGGIVSVLTSIQVIYSLILISSSMMVIGMLSFHFPKWKLEEILPIKFNHLAYFPWAFVLIIILFPSRNPVITTTFISILTVSAAGIFFIWTFFSKQWLIWRWLPIIILLSFWHIIPNVSSLEYSTIHFYIYPCLAVFWMILSLWQRRKELPSALALEIYSYITVLFAAISIISIGLEIPQMESLKRLYHISFVLLLIALVFFLQTLFRSWKTLVFVFLSVTTLSLSYLSYFCTKYYLDDLSQHKFRFHFSQAIMLILWATVLYAVRQIFPWLKTRNYLSQTWQELKFWNTMSSFTNFIVAGLYLICSILLIFEGQLNFITASGLVVASFYCFIMGVQRQINLPIYLSVFVLNQLAILVCLMPDVDVRLRNFSLQDYSYRYQLPMDQTLVCLAFALASWWLYQRPNLREAAKGIMRYSATILLIVFGYVLIWRFLVIFPETNIFGWDIFYHPTQSIYTLYARVAFLGAALLLWFRRFLSWPNLAYPSLFYITLGMSFGVNSYALPWIMHPIAITIVAIIYGILSLFLANFKTILNRVSIFLGVTHFFLFPLIYILPIYFQLRLPNFHSFGILLLSLLLLLHSSFYFLRDKASPWASLVTIYVYFSFYYLFLTKEFVYISTRWYSIIFSIAIISFLGLSHFVRTKNISINKIFNKINIPTESQINFHGELFFQAVAKTTSSIISIGMLAIGAIWLIWSGWISDILGHSLQYPILFKILQYREVLCISILIYLGIQIWLRVFSKIKAKNLVEHGICISLAMLGLWIPIISEWFNQKNFSLSNFFDSSLFTFASLELVLLGMLVMFLVLCRKFSSGTTFWSILFAISSLIYSIVEYIETPYISLSAILALFGVSLILLFWHHSTKIYDGEMRASHFIYVLYALLYLFSLFSLGQNIISNHLQIPSYITLVFFFVAIIFTWIGCRKYPQQTNTINVSDPTESPQTLKSKQLSKILNSFQPLSVQFEQWLSGYTNLWRDLSRYASFLGLLIITISLYKYYNVDWFAPHVDKVPLSFITIFIIDTILSLSILFALGKKEKINISYYIFMFAIFNLYILAKKEIPIFPNIDQNIHIGIFFILWALIPHIIAIWIPTTTRWPSVLCNFGLGIAGLLLWEQNYPAWQPMPTTIYLSAIGFLLTIREWVFQNEANIEKEESSSKQDLSTEELYKIVQHTISTIIMFFAFIVAIFTYMTQPSGYQWWLTGFLAVFAVRYIFVHLTIQSDFALWIAYIFSILTGYVDLQFYYNLGLFGQLIYVLVATNIILLTGISVRNYALGKRLFWNGSIARKVSTLLSQVILTLLLIYGAAILISLTSKTSYYIGTHYYWFGGVSILLIATIFHLGRTYKNIGNFLLAFLIISLGLASPLSHIFSNFAWTTLCYPSVEAACLACLGVFLWHKHSIWLAVFSIFLTGLNYHVPTTFITLFLTSLYTLVMALKYQNRNIFRIYAINLLAAVFFLIFYLLPKTGKPVPLVFPLLAIVTSLIGLGWLLAAKILQRYSFPRLKRILPEFRHVSGFFSIIATILVFAAVVLIKKEMPKLDAHTYQIHTFLCTSAFIITIFLNVLLQKKMSDFDQEYAEKSDSKNSDNNKLSEKTSAPKISFFGNAAPIFIYQFQALIIGLYYFISLRTDWFSFLQNSQPHILIIFSMTFFQIGQYFRKSEELVQANCYEFSSYVLPLTIFCYSPWNLSTTGSAIFALTAVHFGLIYLNRLHIAPLLIALAMLNISLFQFWMGQEIFDPQFYGIPIGLTLMTLAELYRSHLQPQNLYTLRIIGLLSIYGTSSLQVLLKLNNPMYSLVLGILALIGIVLGIILKNNLYLYLASSFLICDVLGYVIKYGADKGILEGVLLVLTGLIILSLSLYFKLIRQKRSQTEEKQENSEEK